MTRLGGLVGVALILAACGTQPIDPTDPASATPRVRVTPRPTPQRTPTPTPDPNEAAIGEAIAITRDGQPWAELTVTETVEEPAFIGTGPGNVDRPGRSGYVFMAAHVTVTASTDGVELDPTAVRIGVDTGEETSQTYSDRGPGADLLPGTLAGGESAAGWVLWEVPEVGRVVLTYDDGAGTTTPRRVVLRDG